MMQNDLKFIQNHLQLNAVKSQQLECVYRIYCVLLHRALARILKLPVILEKMPVKKVDVAKENQVELAVACELVGSRAPP